MELTMEQVKNETDVSFAGVREPGYQELLGRLVRSGAVLPPSQWGWIRDENGETFNGWVR